MGIDRKEFARLLDKSLSDGSFTLFDERGDPWLTEREAIKEYKRNPDTENPDWDRARCKTSADIAQAQKHKRLRLKSPNPQKSPEQRARDEQLYAHVRAQRLLRDQQKADKLAGERVIAPALKAEKIGYLDTEPGKIAKQSIIIATAPSKPYVSIFNRKG